MEMKWRNLQTSLGKVQESFYILKDLHTHDFFFFFFEKSVILLKLKN